MYPNLKLEIFRRGIHQNTVARELGFDEAVLSKIIRGYRKPSDTQRQMLSQYLQANENWLFERYDRGLTTPAPNASDAPATKNGDF